jgi:hypothetical protein
MAIMMKDTASIARKFSQRAQAAGAEYTAGVKSPANDWAQNTAAANDAYKQGVAAASARDAFLKGVSAAGTPKWQKKAIEIGSTRYPQGVAGAEGDYATGFAPYADVLKSLSLPPRSMTGSPQNLQRVAIPCEALHRKKVGG